jgi:hypothetical protein
MILINQVVTTIFAKYHNDAVSIIEGIYSVWEGTPTDYRIPSDMFFLHNLLIELIATYKYYIDENVENRALKEVSCTSFTF